MYYCFCDDFQREGTFAHIIFGIKKTELKTLTDFIKRCKIHYKIDILHCRELFNGYERKKKYPNMKEDDVYNLYNNVLKFLTELGNIPRPLFSYSCYTNEQLKQVKSIKSICMNDINDNSKINIKWTVNENDIKYHLEQVNNLTLFNLLGQNSENCILFRDKIEKENGGMALGGIKNRAKRTSMFFDNGQTAEKLPMLAEYEDSYKEMYEIADFLVYVCGNIKADKLQCQKKEIFKIWYSLINPIETWCMPITS